jgi:hypothetical protein
MSQTPSKPPKKRKSVFINAIVIAALITAVSSILVALINKGALGSSSAPTPTPTLVPTPTPIPPTFIQDTFSASSDNTNSVSLNVTPGDLLIVAITQYERMLSGPNPVIDTKGDLYQQAGNLAANPGQQQDYAELYYVFNAKGGHTKVTVYFGQPSDPDGGDTSLGLFEYRHLSSLDSTPIVTTSPDAKGKVLTLNGKLNTTAATGMCFALGIDSGPQQTRVQDDTTVSGGVGYTLRYPIGNQITDAANGERFYTEDAFVAPGGCKPNFAIAYPSYWGIIGAAFKPYLT